MSIDRKSFDDHWSSLFDSTSLASKSSQKLSFRDKKNDDEASIKDIFRADQYIVTFTLYMCSKLIFLRNRIEAFAQNIWCRWRFLKSRIVTLEEIEKTISSKSNSQERFWEWWLCLIKWIEDEYREKESSTNYKKWRDQEQRSIKESISKKWWRANNCYHDEWVWENSKRWECY